MTLYMVKLAELSRGQRNRAAKGKQSELHRLATLAGRLHDLLGEVKGDTLQSITKRGQPHPLSLQRSLAELVETCCSAMDETGEAEPTIGAPNKPVAGGAADLAVDQYEQATGKAATIIGKDGQAGGPFLNFLSGVFRAAGIVASAEAQGRAAIARRRRRTGELVVETSMLTMRTVPRKEKTPDT